MDGYEIDVQWFEQDPARNPYPRTLIYRVADVQNNQKTDSTSYAFAVLRRLFDFLAGKLR